MSQVGILSRERAKHAKNKNIEKLSVGKSLPLS